MTHPGGGGSNDINLAALWIPVMPETSHMGEEMRKAGGDAKKKFEEGFNSGVSPESLGQSFGSKLSASIHKEFKNFELPFGASAWVDRVSGEIDQKLVNKLKGEATTALRNYRQEYDNLTAAQGRAAEAESKMTLARNNGLNTASVMIPLMQQHSAAVKEVETAHNNATVALGNYHDKTRQVHEAQSAAVDSGHALAGVMGGLMVVGAQLAVGAVEKLAEGIAEGFKGAIEITSELVKKTVELGETYEHIGIQVHEFSTASGESFESMEKAAQQVFSTLDVAGNDVGKTMAQFSSILDVPGEHIKGLVAHVTELQGRFTSLKAADLASIFVAFKTPAEQTDSALASLLHSARNSGQDIGQLTSALSGNAAIVLQEAGMNIQQAGEFMAQLMQMGAPGRQVMTGMSMAMKEFGKEGLSFSDGMKLAATRLRELGDTAAGQDLAEKLFGGRNWAVAMRGVEDYLGVVEKGPDAFNQNSASIDEFLKQTETLGNVWETVKHKAESALAPIGTLLLGTISTAMQRVGDVFTQKHDEIIQKVREIGHSFIDALPDIKDFAETVLRMFGAMANPLKEVLLLVTQTTLGLADIFALVTGNDKLHESIMRSGQALDKLEKLDMSKMFSDAADGVHNFDINTQSLNTQLDQLFDKSKGGGSTSWWGAMGSIGPPGTFPFPVGAPAPTAAPGGPGGIFAGPGGVPGSPTTPLGPGAPPAGMPGGPGGIFAGPGGGHRADWDAIAQKESSGVWNQILSTGITLGGGLQIKPETWADYGGLAFTQNPYQATKEQQIAIAERILNGWGTKPGQGPKAWQNGANYVEKKALGGAPGRSVASGSGSKDDVPALLTRGEYVWDTETMDKYGWLVEALHKGNVQAFDGGGGVLQVIYSNTATGQKTGEAGGAWVGPGTTQPGYYGKDWEGHQGHVHTSFGSAPDGQFYGLPKGTDIRQGQSGFPAWVYQVGAAFGVEASTYAGHQEGSGFNRGIDWWPKGHADMSGSSYTPEEKQRLQQFASSIASYGVTSSQAGSPSAWAATAPLSSGPRGGDYGPSQYPGLPGQYGGGGVYGGETEDQRRQLEKAVQEANDRKTALDHQVIVNQRAVDDLKDQIGKVGTSTKLDVFGKPYPLTPQEQADLGDKRKKLNQQLDDATYQLSVSQRDAAQQTDNITDAQRKQQEGMYKKPSGTSTSGQSSQGKLGQDLGSGFLAGIGQELGLGDVLGKSPLEWGIVKLFGSLFGYANSLGDAVSQATGGGGPGGVGAPGGGGMAGGLLQGLTGSLGINLPKGVSSGPNIATNPAQGMPQPYGQLGTPPGPVIQGDYMPIHVSPNVDPNAILGPVQAQRNADDAHLHGQFGGVPQ